MTISEFNRLIPVCSHGTYVPEVFSIGAGKLDDGAGETPDTGFMRIVNGVSEFDFLSYCETLANADFTCLFQRDAAEGLYREYTHGDTLLYAYFIAAEERVRLILDRASVPLTAFIAEDPAPERFPNTALMQYSLHYDKMIKGYSCDCGMLYALRLRSGELILVDGGEREQATDAAVNDCIKKLTRLCGSETLRVAAWYCTHPHDDHMDFFMKLLRVLGDRLILKRVMFNFPANTLWKLDPCVAALKERLAKYQPDALFLQLHCGMRFPLGSAEIEVLHTHEDALKPEGYDDGRLYDGTNETCAVVRLHFEGQSLLLLGDAGDVNADVMLARYGKLSCTYLQASHHCINRLPQLYANTKAKYVLIPQGDYNLTRGCRRNYRLLQLIYGPKKLLNGDETRVFFDAPAAHSAVAYPHVGSVFDGSAF